MFQISSSGASVDVLHVGECANLGPPTTPPRPAAQPRARSSRSVGKHGLHSSRPDHQRSPAAIPLAVAPQLYPGKTSGRPFRIPSIGRSVSGFVAPRVIEIENDADEENGGRDRVGKRSGRPIGRRIRR
jgi:hypothetical protein